MLAVGANQSDLTTTESHLKNFDEAFAKAKQMNRDYGGSSFSLTQADGTVIDIDGHMQKLGALQASFRPGEERELTEEELADMGQIFEDLEPDVASDCAPDLVPLQRGVSARSGRPVVPAWIESGELAKQLMSSDSEL